MNIIQDKLLEIKRIMHNYNINFYAPRNICLCRNTNHGLICAFKIEKIQNQKIMILDYKAYSIKENETIRLLFLMPTASQQVLQNILRFMLSS